MISVLEHPDLRRRALPIGVDAYHRMQHYGLVPRRAELIRGFIVEKVSKSPLHTRLTDRLRELLEEWACKRFWVRKEDPLTLVDSEPEPDISVVAGGRDDYEHAHPTTALLVVEVAVSAESSDRALIPIYAAAGVTELWLVRAAKKQIECFVHPGEGGYEESSVCGVGEILTSTALPGFQLDVGAFFR
ncbi:MAG: Uma2 family endonuclease [Verrucomicrobiales bacterium]